MFRPALALITLLAVAGCAATAPRAGVADGQRDWASIRADLIACVDRYQRDTLPPEDCSIPVDARTPPEQLGRGLHLVWTGRIPDAEDYLDQLRAQEASPLVLAMLSLDMAFGTGNYAQARARLDALAGDPALPAGLLDDYEVSWALANGEWRDALDRVEALGPEARRSDRYRMLAWSQAAFALGMRGELAAFVEEVGRGPLAGTDEHLGAAFLLNQFDEDAEGFSQFRLPGAGPEPERGVSVRIARLRSEVAQQLGSGCGQACDDLLGLLATRHWDVRRALDTALYFAFFGQPEQAAQALASAPASDRELEAFQSYRLLQAWEQVFRGDLYGALVAAAEAVEMAPNDWEAHWLRVLIAREFADRDMLADSLATIRKVAPWDVLSMSQFGHLSDHDDDPRLCAVALEWVRFLEAGAPAFTAGGREAMEAFLEGCGVSS